MFELRGVGELLVGLLLAAYGWILRDAHARLQRLERESVRASEHQADRAQLEQALKDLMATLEHGFAQQRAGDQQLAQEMVRLHERQADNFSSVIVELHSKIDSRVDALRVELHRNGPSA